MKAKLKSFSRITVVFMLSIVCCCSMLLAIGCGSSNTPTNTNSSIFKEEQTTYVLDKDYTLSDDDESVRKGEENEVKFNFATMFDLGGHTLDLNGRTLSVVSQVNNCVVTFKNGTVKGGTLNVSVPNGDVEFSSVQFNEDVKYNLEAASNTIRMSNSTIKGSCVIKSNTHVEISQSSVGDVTLDGNGTINVNEGSSLNNLEISETATGANVFVQKNATVTGELTLSASANVTISGTVTKVGVKEGATSTTENKVNISVGESAKVNQIELNSAAEVSLKGEVDHVSVANESANVTVSSSANVDQVEVKAAAEVTIEGAVSNVVVSETATGATVDVKESAAINNVVVAANNTEIKVENKDSIDSVKVVENVSGTVVPDNVNKEEITKNDVEDILAHNHDYTITRTEPTCTEDGEIVYTCKTCENVKRVKLAALKHDYKLTDSTDPTCTAKGEKVYTCTRCEDNYSQEVKELGHSYKYEVVTPATETEDGLGKYTCTRTDCNHSYTEVIKAGSKPTVTVNGLSSLFRSILGDTFYFDINNSYTVQAVYEDNYVNDELISHTLKYYDVVYIKQYEMYFDFTEDKQITGYMVYDVYNLSLKSLDNVDLDNFDSIEDYLENTRNAVYMYVQGDKIYAKQIDKDSDNEKFTPIEELVCVIDFDLFVEYLKKDSDVPAPVQAIATVLDYVFNEAQEEIDLEAVKAKLQGIIDAITGDQSTEQKPLPNAVLDWIVKNCFDTTEEEGNTVYTLNLQKLKAKLDNYGAMTLSQYIDAANGKGTSAKLKETLNLVPALNLKKLVEVAEGAVKNYGLTIDDVYSVIEFVFKKSGMEFNAKEFVENYGTMKVADVLVLMNDGMTVEEAQSTVDAMVESVVGSMDTMTVNDLLTAVMNMMMQGGNGNVDGGSGNVDNYEVDPESGETNEGEEQTTPTFMDYVDMLIDGYGDQISLVIVKKANGDANYKLSVMGYKVEFDLSNTKDLTLDLIFGTIEATMAHVNAILTETTAKVTVEVLNYTANFDYNQAAGEFALVVNQKVETTDTTTGESEITENELAKLTFVNNNEKLNVSLKIMGVETLSGLCDKVNNNLTFTVLMGETTTVSVVAAWTTVDGVTTVDVSLLTGDQEMMAMQVVVDNSVADTYNVELSIGQHDESKAYQKLADVMKATVKTIAEEEKVTGLQGSIYTNDNVFTQFVGSNSEMRPEKSNDSEILGYSQAYLTKYNFKVMFNESKTYDLTIVADAKAQLEKFYNINAANVNFNGDYETEESTIEYVNNDDGEYYVVKVASYRPSKNNYDPDCVQYTGTLTVTTTVITLPAEKGYIKSAYLSIGRLCGDWYELSLMGGGLPSQKTEVVYQGLFEREYYENYPDMYKYVPTTESQVVNTYVGSASTSEISFAYNVKTKESTNWDYSYSRRADSGVHNLEIKRTFDNGYHYCNAGVTVEYKCLDCGKEYTEKRYSCDYELTKTYKYTTSCGTEIIQVYTCKNCGNQKHTNLSYNDFKGHSFGKDELSATCSKCGLTYNQTVTCKQQNGQCVPNVTLIYTLEGETLLELTYVDYTNDEHTESSYYYWRNDDESEDFATDEEANNWLSIINKELKINLSLNDCTRLDKQERKCATHGDLLYTSYSFETAKYFGQVTYKYGRCYHKYLQGHKYNESDANGYEVSDVSEYLGDYDYDFSELKGTSATMEIDGYLSNDYMSLTYRFYLNNGDVIALYTYGDSSLSYHSYDSEIQWYHYNECKEERLYFVEDSDAAAEKTYRLDGKNVNARHVYKTTSLGKNCCEDGVTKACVVCHNQEDEVRYEHDGSLIGFSDSYSYEGMRIEGNKRLCCESYDRIIITLNSNVTLSEDMYFLSDYIRINLNGYTLDLNGYDLVLVTYEKGLDLRINLEDINDRGESGKIVNTSESGNGYFVCSSYNGTIEYRGITCEANSVLLDTVSRKELQKYFVDTYEYTLTLNEAIFGTKNN